MTKHAAMFVVLATWLVGACGTDTPPQSDTPNLTQAPPQPPPDPPPPETVLDCVSATEDERSCEPNTYLPPLGVKVCSQYAGHQALESFSVKTACAGDQFSSASFRCCAPPPPPAAGCRFTFETSQGGDPPAHTPGACLSRDTWDSIMKYSCQLGGSGTAQIIYKGACGADGYLWAYAYCCP